jgi:4-coumarate--CoA ligase
LNEEKIAIVDGSTGMQRTFKDYYVTATNLAGALRYDFGVTDCGTTIALFCPNHVDYAPIILAVALCGAKLTPINPLFKRMELETILNQSHCSILIAHTSTLDVALDTIAGTPPVKHVIVVTDEVQATSDGRTSGESVFPAGTVSLDQLRSHRQAFDKTIEKVIGNTVTYPVVIPYSSGTTGLPKGVCLTHSNIVSNQLQQHIVEGPFIQADHTIFSPLPFYHMYAFMVSLLYSAWQGLTLVTMSKRFNLEQFCQLVEKHAPERCHLVPPILLRLANDPIVSKYDMTSIRIILSAAAPLSPDIEDAVVKRIGEQCKVKQLFGMSELSCTGTICSDNDIKRGSVGKLVSNTIGKILDRNGNSLPPNQSGELALLGPQVMMGYLNNPEKTKESLSEKGWLLSGDIAHYDKDGYFYVTDRIKDLIKVRGHQVAPAELEALLLQHPAIVDAAVVGVPDKYSGELCRAYVVLRQPWNHSPVTESDVYEYLKDLISPQKRLDGGVAFIDAIPKSASGKILRRVLRDQAKQTGNNDNI